ncbi:MAG: septal ring lytic transglycosylase RlpA family protein [Acidobacteriia bacterium]|nr:septal ring lytic transglycosylase RlpA family protein [Terriglobia bacterium]
MVRGRTSARDVLATRVLVLGILVVSTACVHRRRPPAPSPRRVPMPTTTRPQAAPVPAPPQAPTSGIQGETGIASWYGHPFHGRRTANGETYNMYDMTAAHRTLPFGTQVRVHDLENGRDVQVRINDRGPFVEGRIIDLSFAAAQAMGMPSTALVRLELLGAETPGIVVSEPGIFGVQVGAFRDRANAERLGTAIASRYGPVSIQIFDRGDAVFYRVRVGREATEEAAEQLGRELQHAGFATEVFAVRLN